MTLRPRENVHGEIRLQRWYHPLSTYYMQDTDWRFPFLKGKGSLARKETRNFRISEFRFWKAPRSAWIQSSTQSRMPWTSFFHSFVYATNSYWAPTVCLLISTGKAASLKIIVVIYDCSINLCYLYSILQELSFRWLLAMTLQGRGT